MTRAGDEASRDEAGEVGAIAGRIFRWPEKAVVSTEERDGRHVDLRAHRQAMLGCIEASLALGIQVAMPIGMNDALHEIGVVEGRRGPVVRRVCKMPRRRPGCPEQLAQRAPIRGKAGAAAFGVEVPLIPECLLSLWRCGTRRR